MDACTIEPVFQLPDFHPHLSTNAPSSVSFSNPPPLQVDDNLGAIRGLLYAVAFQGILALVFFAGWGLWHLLR